jgi:YfiH family protein
MTLPVKTSSDLSVDAAAERARSTSPFAKAPAVPGIVPVWPVSARIGAFVTTRQGGVSAGAFGRASGQPGGLNLGDHVGDDPVAVQRNRARLEDRLPGPVCWLKQVHGVEVFDADCPEAMAPEAADPVPVADAAVTTRPGRVLAIMTADCLPVLLADPSGRVVAAAHAGWRGLAGGVLEASVAAMRARLPASAAIVAWLGPAIGPTAFEVGDEVKQAFCAQDEGAEPAFQPGPLSGKWMADLYQLARRRLEACGVRCFGDDLCTVSDPERFYSHRRDRQTGRMVSLIWIDG